MTTSPHLRPMAAADVPAIARLLRESAETFIVHEFVPAARAHFLAKNDAAAIARFVADGFRYHVAEEDGTIVGFGGVRDDRHLCHPVVAESHRRRGIAGRLRDVAAADCRARGHAGPFTVNSSNHAVAFYEQLGFRRTAPVQDHDGVLFNPMALPADA